MFGHNDGYGTTMPVQNPIQPTPGTFNEAALQRFDFVMNALAEVGARHWCERSLGGMFVFPLRKTAFAAALRGPQRAAGLFQNCFAHESNTSDTAAVSARPHFATPAPRTLPRY